MSDRSVRPRTTWKTRSGSEIVAVVPGPSYLRSDRSPTRGLLCSDAGTADVNDAMGNEVDGVALQPGTNPLEVTKIRATTVTNMWALY